MKQQVDNFGRFFSAFGQLKIHGDRDDAKRELVLQYTDGRTDSLREMSRKEYSEMCAAIERMTEDREELRKRRSIVLKLMQELEVDTRDWAQINDFCRHPRIGGKAFGQLSVEELKELAKRLRTIKLKGWQRKPQATAPAEPSANKQISYLINLAPAGKA